MRTELKYSVELHYVPPPKYKNLCIIDQWCNENCEGNWVFGRSIYGQPMMTKYVFEYESDAFAFMMRWL